MRHNQSPSETTLRHATRTGSGGYAGQNHTRPADDPGRSSSSRPSRTFSALCLLAGAVLLPCLASAAGQEPAPATFDVAPGGILAALAAAATSALGTWAAMRNRPARSRHSVRVEDQPLKVEAVPGHTLDPVCVEKHAAIAAIIKVNTEDHANIFARVSSVESRISKLEGSIAEVDKQLKSIDDKLTILLRRK